MPAMITSDIDRVEFFFDPGCPWTWKTAQWLMASDAGVTWRPFRLEFLMDGAAVPEEWAAGAASSQVALRLVEHLAASDRHEDIGNFYSALGERIHNRLEPQSIQLVREVVDALGLDADALDDANLDDGVRQAFNEAQRLVGPNLGSPVLSITFANGQQRGIFGPIVTDTFATAEANQLWAATSTMLRFDQLAEVKRARGLHHDLDASLTPHSDPD